jgi:nitroreductase
MQEVLKLIRDRQSVRTPFDPKRPVAKQDLLKILEAARWSPTPHNMQNFEIIVIDDKKLLEKIGNIKSPISEEFLRENYQQLSFSEKELLQKKVGLLGALFPSEWRNPDKLGEVARKSAPFSLSEVIDGSPTMLIVIYDSRKRAPASEGDFLGITSLGCVMENMWLMAQSLAIAFHIISDFGENPVEKETKRILHIPDYIKIAFGCRLGYPISKPAKRLRVRRDVEDFTHHNRFGERGISMEVVQ